MQPTGRSKSYKFIKKENVDSEENISKATNDIIFNHESVEDNEIKSTDDFTDSITGDIIEQQNETSFIVCGNDIFLCSS